MHTPVLLKEVIEGLNIKSGGKYIDATVGEGGHLRQMLSFDVQVLAIDWNKEQIDKLKIKFEDHKDLILEVGNFADIEQIAKNNNFFPADGILFDLGLSMGELNYLGRGFSYEKLDEPLDLRLSDRTEINAKDIVNSFSKDKLYEIFAYYSEEINSLAIAQSIVAARHLKKIEKVGQLLMVIDKTLGRRDRGTYARIFQALRIAVNDEFNNLKKGLGGALNILKADGRIAVVTFHSMEDRIVKNFIKERNLRMVNKKVVAGILRFERSAKLRVISKT